MHSFLHDTGAGHWLGHSLMVVVMITVLVLILAGTYLLLSALLGERQADRGEPLEVLAERYARGEIEREAFLRRQQDLLTDEQREQMRERRQERRGGMGGELGRDGEHQRHHGGDS